MEPNSVKSGWALVLALLGMGAVAFPLKQFLNGLNNLVELFIVIAEAIVVNFEDLEGGAEVDGVPEILQEILLHFPLVVVPSLFEVAVARALQGYLVDLLGLDLEVHLLDVLFEAFVRGRLEELCVLDYLLDAVVLHSNIYIT